MTQNIFADGILNGRVAFVTGGGTGITGGLARAFAEAGASVALVSRKMDHLRPAADAQPVRTAANADADDVPDHALSASDLTDRNALRILVWSHFLRRTGVHFAGKCFRLGTTER